MHSSVLASSPGLAQSIIALVLGKIYMLTHVYWLMRIERSEICINKYENWEAVLIIALKLNIYKYIQGVPKKLGAEETIHVETKRLYEISLRF